MSFPTADHETLLAKVAELISVWNAVEEAIKYCILSIEEPQKCDGLGTARILITYLNSRSLTDAARAVAGEFMADPCKEAFTHGLANVDIIRDHRNYYVHGFANVGWNGEGEPVGFLLTTTARSRLTQHDTTFTADELEKLIEALRELRLYFGGVLNSWRGRIDQFTGKPTVLPRRPARPPRLEKRRRFLLDPQYRGRGPV